jgi:hypothetical protein
LFSEENVYIVGRSTKRKKDIIAKEFNIINKTLTHIGVGIFENNMLRIYSISNYNLVKDVSALVIESIDEFINVDDISYYSIWEKKCSKTDIANLKINVQRYQTKNIIFDYDFKMDNGKLYCSEFVYLLLKETNISNLEFFPTKKKLNRFYSKALKRNILEYIPTDFFLESKEFKLVYTFNINK